MLRLDDIPPSPHVGDLDSLVPRDRSDSLKKNRGLAVRFATISRSRDGDLDSLVARSTLIVVADRSDSLQKNRGLVLRPFSIFSSYNGDLDPTVSRSVLAAVSERLGS